eukprot:TRINITY_DN1205_c0_g3_i1.p1 TRINITY_DN1205_c0_g3~~TRINITY_DN1205_c0_g3_i1.p1  ORF type:complete len:677 (+),score=197.34 TRINITY_DN1205_c0_g3_i1:35-2032(+)
MPPVGYVSGYPSLQEGYDSDTRGLRREIGSRKKKKKKELVTTVRGGNPFDVSKGRISVILDRLGEKRNAVPVVDLTVLSRKASPCPSAEPSPSPSPRSRQMDEKPWKKPPLHIPIRQPLNHFIKTMDGTLTINPQAPFGSVVKCLKRHLMTPYVPIDKDKDPLLVGGGTSLCSKCDRLVPAFICTQCIYEYYLCRNCAAEPGAKPARSPSPMARSGSSRIKPRKGSDAKPDKKLATSNDSKVPAQPVVGVSEGKKLLDMLVAEHGGDEEDAEEEEPEEVAEPEPEPPQNDYFENMSDYSLAGSMKKIPQLISSPEGAPTSPQHPTSPDLPTSTEVAAPEAANGPDVAGTEDEAPSKDEEQQANENTKEEDTKDTEAEAAEEAAEDLDESLQNSNADLSTEELMKKLATAFGEWDDEVKKREQEEALEEQNNEKEEVEPEQDPPEEEAEEEKEEQPAEEEEKEPEHTKTPTTPAEDLGEPVIVVKKLAKPQTRKEKLAGILGTWGEEENEKEKEKEKEKENEKKNEKEEPEEFKSLLEEWNDTIEVATEGSDGSGKRSPSPRAGSTTNLHRSRSSMSELALPARGSPSGSLRSSLRKQPSAKGTFGSARRHIDFALNTNSPGPAAYNAPPENPEFEPPIVRTSSWARSKTKRVSIQHDIKLHETCT